MGLPDSKPNLILRYKWLGEVVAVVLAVFAGAIGSIKVYSDLSEANERMVHSDGSPVSFSGFWWIVASATMTVAGAIYKAMVAKAESRKAIDKESPEDLYGCCAVMHSLLCSGDAGVRITIHRIAKDGKQEHLEQLIPYALCPGTDAGEHGRRFPIHCGIIGKAVRLKNPIVASRVSESAEDFRLEMVSEWGYTEEQAKDLDSSRRSWMAVPISDKRGRVVGVLFLDSTQKDYFTDSRTADILRGAEELNRFTKERYR